MPKRKIAGGVSVKRTPSHRKPSGERKKRSACLHTKSGKRSCAVATPASSDEVRALFLEAWPDIVRGLIYKAANGGYQQAKLLLELFELPAASISEFSDERKQQLCDALLEGWGLIPTQAGGANGTPTAKAENAESGKRES